MKIEERITKIETEIRILCDKLKTEEDPKDFQRQLVKEMRQNGYIVVHKWEQRGRTVEILGWKLGLPVAIAMRQGEEYIQTALDSLLAVVNEKYPERIVVRIVINHEQTKLQEDELQAYSQGVIFIKPGELEPQQNSTGLNVQASTEGELPF